MTLEACLRAGPTSARTLRRRFGLLPGELLEELTRVGAVRCDRGGRVLWRLVRGVQPGCIQRCESVRTA